MTVKFIYSYRLDVEVFPARFSKNNFNNRSTFFVVRFKNKVCLPKFYMGVNNFDRFVKRFPFEINLTWFALKGHNRN